LTAHSTAAKREPPGSSKGAFGVQKKQSRGSDPAGTDVAIPARGTIGSHEFQEAHMPDDRSNRSDRNDDNENRQSSGREGGRGSSNEPERDEQGRFESEREGSSRQGGGSSQQGGGSSKKK
jgi:hypothetical protein